MSRRNFSSVNIKRIPIGAEDKATHTRDANQKDALEIYNTRVRKKGARETFVMRWINQIKAIETTNEPIKCLPRVYTYMHVHTPAKCEYTE